MKTIQMTTKVAVNWLQGPVFWIINLGIILVCFISGPFGTLDALPGGFRLIYWSSIVLATGLLGVWMCALLRTNNWRAFSKTIAVSIVFGLLVAGIVLLLSLALLAPIDKYPGHVRLFSYSFPSAVITFVAAAYVMFSLFKAGKQPNDESPALLKRLENYPHSKKILSLTAQDHYVEVVTELGKELCLMRLSDAIAEVTPQKGFQIHRSYWVAIEAVEKIVSSGSNVQAKLIDGRTLSVSQSRVDDFRKYLKDCD